MVATPKPLVRAVAVGGFCVVLLLLWSYRHTTSSTFSSWASGSGRKRAPCPPQAYNAGQWVYDASRNLNHSAVDASGQPISPAPHREVREREDIISMAGFEGCASNREFWWHLAADKPSQYGRWPDVDNWDWVPPEEQCELRKWRKEEMVLDLVEKGGWLLIGDSVTENHFFSLSCMLYPHVLATPDYVANPYFDRAWPQHLYLNPASPLLTSSNILGRALRLPKGFNLTGTPLVTFRRVDLLLNQPQLEELHRDKYPEMYTAAVDTTTEDEGFKLFSKEAAWSLDFDYVRELFQKPLPEANYGTMVASTGGHWTTTLFAGYRDESKASEGYGIDGVVAFFEQAMTKWAGDVQDALDESQGGRKSGGVVQANGKKAPRQVVIRAYLPGHEDCHDHKKAWTDIQPMRWFWYNWGNIWQYNDVFERVLSSPSFPNVHFLGIDRPARLRPDAHVASDCLHIMTGAGVLEGWTHYVWHYVTVEVWSKVR
ncbi:hypothetical protein CYLTODRAFT_493228 [Cylindrobasidium torrendii FP15055 ss-10]|uniref:Uncharacterized protein n=1 Tax=Cylindrobasidium torrendii FP15055 ss-10 TaxID=1314674 RepID=A0A0D7B1F2_9AGAR|nr:hypothetical protein CYLTODRAFT_493228 [Cylindrobasidium torrendii FP15055 ss-10]